MCFRYDLGKLLGKGGFGKVNIVTETCSGRQYACKAIAKRLDVPNLSPQKQATHLDNVRREVGSCQPEMLAAPRLWQALGRPYEATLCWKAWQAFLQRLYIGKDLPTF